MYYVWFDIIPKLADYPCSLQDISIVDNSCPRLLNIDHHPDQYHNEAPPITLFFWPLAFPSHRHTARVT